MNKARTLMNEPDDKKADDNVQVLTSNRCQWDTIWIKKERRRKRNRRHWRQHASIESLKTTIKKSQGGLITATRNNDEKHNDKRNINNCETDIRRKATVRVFQTINKRNLTWEDLVIAEKKRSQEIKWISFNSSIKQRHKDQIYLSKNWQYTTK